MLVERLGLARAMALALTGDKLPSTQAKEWGMIWDVSDDCLGASLARLEIKAMFEQLLAKVDRFERPADGTIVDIPNSFVYGLKHADITVVPN